MKNSLPLVRMETIGELGTKIQNRGDAWNFFILEENCDVPRLHKTTHKNSTFLGRIIAGEAAKDWRKIECRLSRHERTLLSRSERRHSDSY